MRKLLLATVAVLGVTTVLADTGFAQSSSDDSGQAAGPAPGTITVRLNGRIRVYGGVIADGDANGTVFTNTAPRRSCAEPEPWQAPALSFPEAARSSRPSPSRGAGNVSGFGVLLPAPRPVRACQPPLPSRLRPASSLQRNKQSNYTIASYTRLYPGFDGVAANGLKYGASFEIRQDNDSGAGNGVVWFHQPAGPSARRAVSPPRVGLHRHGPARHFALRLD